MSAHYIHATAVLIDGKGLLIRGPSRAGKSTLALDLLERFSATLIGDDRVEISNVGGQLLLRGHPLIAGKIEKRGATPLDSKILDVPFAASGMAHYVIDLSDTVSESSLLEPHVSECSLCGVQLPLIELPRDLDPTGFDASGIDRAGWLAENLLHEMAASSAS